MLCGMRWLLISKILLTRCRPLDHTDLPLFSRYFTSINMVIFFVALAISAACARFRSFIVAWLWRTMVVRRLILATEVAFVMIVRVMVALSVVVVAIATAQLAIFGVVAAILVGVLCLVAMDVARFWGCRGTPRRCALPCRHGRGKVYQKTPAGLFARTCHVCSRCRETFYSRDRDCDHRDNCDCVRCSVRRPCSSLCRRTCVWQCLAELQTFYDLAARVEALVCHCSF